MRKSISALQWQIKDGDVKNIYGTWKKHGPALYPDQEFEKDKLIKSFPSTILELNGKLRLYYYVYSGGHCSDYNLAIAEQPFKAMEFATNWEKHSLKRNKEAYFSLEGLPDAWYPIQANVIKINSDQWRMFFWAHGDGISRFVSAESKNGLNWTVLNAEKPCLYHIGNDRDSKQNIAPHKFRSADATTVYKTPDGIFEMFSSSAIICEPQDPRYIGHDTSPGALRFVQRWQSKDALNWERPDLILVPDEKDPIDLQFYYLSVAYLQNYRLGFAGYYTGQNQVQGMELMLSTDGINWQRPVRGNCFPMNDIYDCYGVYAPQSFVFSDNRLIMYYSGTNATHNKEKCSGPKVENTIAAASINYRKIFGREVKNGSLLSPAIKLAEYPILIYFEGKLTCTFCDLLGREWKNCPPVELFQEDNDNPVKLVLPESLIGQVITLKLSGDYRLFDLEF